MTIRQVRKLFEARSFSARASVVQPVTENLLPGGAKNQSGQNQSSHLPCRESEGGLRVRGLRPARCGYAEQPAAVGYPPASGNQAG